MKPIKPKPINKTLADRAMEHKLIVLYLQDLRNCIVQAINKINFLRSWTPQQLEDEGMAVISLDTSLQYLDEAADHCQMAANRLSGGRAYRMFYQVSGARDPDAIRYSRGSPPRSAAAPEDLPAPPLSRDQEDANQ